MIVPLWIFSTRNNWWTNGKHTITNELVQWLLDWQTIREYYYEETGLKLDKEPLKFWYRRPQVEMPRRTPEEVIALLENK